MMITRCPACQTVFRLRPEQLHARGGEVRCGHCFHPFNALENTVEVRDDGGAAASAPPPRAASPVREARPDPLLDFDIPEIAPAPPIRAPQPAPGLEGTPPSLRGKAAHGAFHLDAFGVGLQGGICDIGAGQDQGQRQNELESLMHSDECCVTTAPKQCFFRAQSNAVPVSPILQTLLGGARKTPTICWSKRYR